MQEASSNITLKRAARLLGVHEQTLRSWEKRGIIRLVRLPRSGYRRVPLTEIHRLQKEMLSTQSQAPVMLTPPKTDAASQASALAMAEEVRVELQDMDASTTFDELMGERRGRQWSL